MCLKFGPLPVFSMIGPSPCQDQDFALFARPELFHLNAIGVTVIGVAKVEVRVDGIDRISDQMDLSVVLLPVVWCVDIALPHFVAV